jgi:hypothetical protein
MKAIAHMSTEKGRRIGSDWTSIRDAPPVMKTTIRNAARSQNCGAGLSTDFPIFAKSASKNLGLRLTKATPS